MIKIKNIFMLLFSCVVVLSLQGCADEVDFTLKQVEEEQLIEITLNEIVLNYEVEVYCMGDLISKEIFDYKDESVTVSGVYGYNEVVVTAHLKDYSKTTEKTIGLSASEYNIAGLNATMPVTLFSIELNEISKDVPTFIMLERTGAYNWDSLPENTFRIPGFSDYDFNSNVSGEEMHSKIYDWISDLYEINSSSFFNVYYNDVWLSAAIQVTTGNGIPDSNFHLYLLSDGSMSSVVFNEIYNVENPYEVYDDLLIEYNEMMNNVKIENDDSMYNNFNGKFLYTMINENDNVEYWATRIQYALYSKDEDFQNDILTNEKMLTKNLSSILTSLSEENQTNLKSLFNFSESFFEEAVVNDKKVMVILGTWDHNESYFEEYVSFIQEYYGDDYVYYYKGHPYTPTQLVDGKYDYLDSLNLIDVDSTIPAELILFFNQDVYCSGYASTTFESVSDDKVMCVFGEYSSSNDTYLDKIDVRIEVESDGVFLITFSDNKTALFYFDSKEIVYL